MLIRAAATVLSALALAMTGAATSASAADAPTETRIAWDTAYAVDADTIAVVAQVPNPACNETRVEVLETYRTIYVNTYSKPMSNGRVCSAQMVKVTLTADTKAPIAGRTISQFGPRG